MRKDANIRRDPKKRRGKEHVLSGPPHFVMCQMSTAHLCPSSPWNPALVARSMADCRRDPLNPSLSLTLQMLRTTLRIRLRISPDFQTLGSLREDPSHKIFQALVLSSDECKLVRQSKESSAAQSAKNFSGLSILGLLWASVLPELSRLVVETLSELTKWYRLL